MARVILGLATSHTPQLSSPVSVWPLYGDRDRANPALVGPGGRRLDYGGLLELRRVAPGELSPETWAQRHQRAQDAIQRLADTLAAAAPDIVVIIGDDQGELFGSECTPALAVYGGDGVENLPPRGAALERIPRDVQAGLWAYHGDEPERYATTPTLARHLSQHLTTAHYDVAHLAQQHEGRTIGHAFTFVCRRIMTGFTAPILPVLVNTYYPPNQPSAERCYSFGQEVRRAVESWEGDETVAVVASGGLSHFVVDEEFDRRVLDALASRNVHDLTSIESSALQSGTSETLNWIALAGAVEHLEMQLIDYVPAYRTEAGTGCGMAFASWHV